MCKVIELKTGNEITKKLSEEEIEELADKLREEEKSAEYFTLHEGSALAEFTETFCYGEADWAEVRRDIVEALIKGYIWTGDHDNDEKGEWIWVEEEEAEELMKHLDNMPSNADRFDFLERFTSLSLEGIFLACGEILGTIIGEIEWQISDELSAELEGLSAEDLKEVANEAGVYLHGNCIYVDYNYDRWCLILDVEEFYKELKNEGDK